MTGNHNVNRKGMMKSQLVQRSKVPYCGLMLPLERILLLAVCALSVAGVLAAQPEVSHQGPPGLERMKSLAGTWKGKADMGQGPMEITVEYRVVSGGSAVEERVFAGTSKEMVTMYFDRNGKLALTHYCMLGNRPGMLLEAADGNTLRFDFDATCGVDANSEMHMHSLTITFENADAIKEDWRLFQDGKPKDSHPFVLKRVKA
jgi:hypothetical protein